MLMYVNRHTKLEASEQKTFKKETPAKIGDTTKPG
jgi:hypothetical protein